MAYVNHSKLIRDRIMVRANLGDGTIKRVLVVEANMPLTENDPNFDQNEFDALIQAVMDGMKRVGADESEIIQA